MKNNLNILIVEDNLLIAHSLTIILTELGHQVIAAANNGIEALEVLESVKPDVVLLDINLQSGINGIQIAEEINEKYGLPFIFVTGYIDPTTVKLADKVQPAGYLPKPFSKETIQLALELAMEAFKIRRKNQNPENEEAIISDFKDNFFFIRQRKGQIKIETKQICWIKAMNTYSKVCVGEKEYVFTQSLKQFEEKLMSTSMTRVHRSYIVNLDFVAGMTEGKLKVNGRLIPIGKSYRPGLLAKFKII